MTRKLCKLLLPFLLIAFSLLATAQDIPKWKIDQLEEYIRKSDRPVIVNFWATFCKPCIVEVPYFQKLVKKYEQEGVELLLVSLDLEQSYKKIKPFAQKHHFTAPIVFLDETNADEFCPRIDERWSGAIPASLFINNKTGYRKFHEEQIPEKKLEGEIKLLIGKK